MKKFTLLFFLTCFGFLVGKAQVTVTPATLTNLCVGSATYTPLGNITITETNNADITNGTGLTLVLSMPANFELEPLQGSTAISGGGASAINSTTVTATTVTINYDAVTPTSGFTISGLRVRAITSASAGDLIFSGGSGVIAGITTGTTVAASFTSVAPPTITVVNSGTSACFGSALFFSASGASQYQFEVKQGVTSIDLQAYSATSTYTTSNTLPAGSYTMEVLGRDANNCVSLLSSTAFTINTLPASPTVTGGSPKNYCVGTATSTTINATGIGTLRWYSDIALTTEITAGTATAKTLANLGITTASASSTTFYLISENAGCRSVATPLVVNITALPTLSVFASGSSVCAGQTITFIGSASGTGIQYEFVLKQGVTTVATQAYSTTPFYITSNALAANTYSMEVTARDGSNCTSTLNATAFTINALPTAPTVSPATLNYCIGTSTATTIAATGTTGTVEWFGDASLTTVLATGTSASLSSLGVNTGSANVYTRYVTQRDGNNCRSAATLVTVNVVANPFFSINSNQPANNKICAGSTITYTPAGLGVLSYGYQLERTIPSFAIVETIPSPAPSSYTIPTTLTVGTYRVRVQATNSFGCTTTSLGTPFQVLANPTVTFPTPSPSSFLDSQTTPVTLSATPVPVAGETGVFSGPGVSGNQFIPSASGGAGAKTITYTFTNADGCVATASITLNINTSGFFIGQSYCQDDGASLLIPAGGCGLITGVNPYFPAPPGSITNTGSNYFFNPSTMTIPTGQDFVLWEGAVFTQSCIPFYIFTRVFRSPAPNITGDNAVCRNDVDVYFTTPYSFSNAGGNVSYLWEFETGPGLVSGTFLSGTNSNFVNVRWNSAGNARLKLTQTNNYTSPVAASCTKIDFFDVVINDLPTGTISIVPAFPTTACQGDTKNYTCTGILGATYNWSVTNGTIQPDGNATDNQVTVLWDNISTFNITGSLSVQITNLSGCQNIVSASQTLQGLPNPNFGATNDFEVCVGEAGKVYNVTATFGHSYAWTVTGGTIVGATNTNSITVNWGNTAGTGTVQVTQRNGANCPTTISKSVIINALPSNTITGSTTVCEDDTHTYQASTAGSYTYSWSVTNGVIVGLATGSNVVVKWNIGVTSGTLNLNINEPSTGCGNTRNQAITIQPRPAPAITGNSVVCEASTQVYSTPAVANMSYSWTVTGGTISGASTGNSITVVWGGGVTGTVSIKQTNNVSLCERTVSLPIAINPLPNPFILGDAEVCANSSGYIYVTPPSSDSPPNTFLWSIVGGTINSGAGTNIISVTWNTAGVGSLTLTETNLSNIPNCSKSVTLNVDIRPLPNPTFTTSSVNVCRNQLGVAYTVPNVPMNSYIWTVTGGSIASGAGTNSVTVNWGTGTSGTVSVEQKDNNFATSCSRSISLPITLNPVPTPAITGGSTTVCALSTHTYTTAAVAGHSYNWTVVGGTFTGQGTNAITVTWGSNPAGARIEIIQTDNNFATACSNPVVTQSITINTLPTPSISPTANTCIGSALTSDVSYSTIPTAGSSYSWTVTNGSIISGQGTNSIVVRWGNTGTNGTIQVVQTLSTGCAWSDFRTITFNALPTPAITGDDTPCANSTGISYQTPLVAGSTYLWSVIGGSIASGSGTNAITVNWGGSGAGSVKIQETNANGCKQETTLLTNILSLPNPDITPKTAVCAFSAGNVYQVTNNAGAAYAWTISGGTIISGAGTNAITVNWHGTGIGVLTVVETLANGCSNQPATTQNIAINLLPVPVIAGAKAVCAQASGVIYSVTPSANQSYSWSVSGGSFAPVLGNPHQISVTWGSAGAGTVNVTQINDLTNCVQAVSENIVIRALPTPTITGASQVCELSTGSVYETAELLTTPNITHTYAWSVTNGTLNVNGLTPYKATIDWDVAGTEVVELTVTTTTTDPLGILPPTSCQTIVTQTVTVNPLPTPFITPFANLCELSQETYTINNQAGRSFNWTVSGGAIASGQGTHSIVVNWGNAGAGSVQVVETILATGCSKTDNFNITLYPLPVPDITLSTTLPVTAVCELSTGHRYQTNLNAGASYTWQVIGGAFVPVAGNPHQIDVTWGNAGVGTITVTETTSNSCQKSDTKNININALPAPVITGNASVCEFSNQVYTVPFTAGSSYSWYVFKISFPFVVPLAFTPNANGNEITIADIGTFGSVIVGVDETNANGCLKEVSLDVDVNKLPNPDITPENDVCLNTVQTYQTTLTATSNYVWSLTPASAGTIVQGATPTTKHQATVTWTGVGAGTLSVTETDVNGCIKTVTEIIDVRPLPNPIITTDVPHGFSVCAGQASVKYSVIGLAGNSYTWTVLGGTIIGSNLGNEITVNWGAAGTGIVEVTQIDNNFTTKCETSVLQSVIIRTLPVPVITSGSGMFEVCASTNGATYATPSIAGHSYKWTVTGGTIVGSDTNNSVVIDWGTNPTGAKIEVKETNNNFATNCEKIIAQDIFIRPLPTPNIVGDASVCAQSAGKVYQVSPVTGHTYVWSVVGGTIVGSNTNNSITVNWGSNPVGAQVQVIQTDNNFPTNCAVTNTKAISIQPLPTPNVTGTGIGVGTVCASIDAENFYEYTYSTLQVVGNTYTWTIDPTQGDITSGQFSNTIRVRWKQGLGTGTIKVAQTTNTFPACTVEDTKTVTINDLPTTNFTISNVCFGESTTFTPTVTNPNWTWKWDFSEGLPITTATANRTFITTGLKTAKVTVKNTVTGCEYKRDTTFTIHPVPVADFKFGNTCISSAISFQTQFTDLSTVAQPDNVTAWLWTINKVGTPTANYTIQNPTHVFPEAGVYTVTLRATSNNNCAHTISKDVRIYPIIQPTDTAPYTQDFEVSEGNWISHGVGNTWQRGIPANRTVQSPSNNIWTTGLSANYNDNAQAYVESPCFDLSALVRPMISLKTWVDTDNKADGASILYSVDGGNSWKTLGEVGKGLEWYNQENILGISNDNNNPRKAGWTGKQTDWTVSKYNLDAIKTEAAGNTVRFRVAFGSNADNPISTTLDGFAFDDVYIGNRQQRALVEHFTTMEATVENAFVDNFSSEATKLQYHTKDVLYNDNPADATARSLMYGIAVTTNNNTRGALNGVAKTDRKFSTWGAEEAEKQLLGTPAFDIKLAYLPTPTDKLNLQIKVKALQAYNKDVVLHIVMVEEGIRNTLTNNILFKNVVKKMLPSAAGTTIRDDWTIGLEKTYTENITLYNVPQSTALAPKLYDKDSLKMVVFIQDFETNEVLQVAELKPTSTPNLVSALADDGQGTCLIYPNPAQNEVFIGFKQEAFRTYNWEIQNMQGQVLNQGIIQKGEAGVQVQTQNLPAGMYVVRITHPQTKSSWVGKLVIKK